MAWTDERMDDLSTRMDAGFQRADKDNRDLRAEMNAGFDRVDHDVRDLRVEVRSVRDELKGDIADLRSELKGDIADLRSEIGALQTLTMRFGSALLVGMIGVIATLMGVIATGALSA